jgi:Cytochrome P460
VCARRLPDNASIETRRVFREHLMKLVVSSVVSSLVAASAVALLAASFLPASADEPAQAAVAYPDGYRSWSHIRSGLIAPTHKGFDKNGGFQHIYANTPALEGYRTRQFPEGSVIVVDWFELQQNDNSWSEGPRRQLDVMVKDSQRYAGSGGWGFQRFVKDSTTELAAAPTPRQCFDCHDKLKKDGLVLSSSRK